MVKRMLIDATHPEETRVVVMDGTRLEEFDVETSTKKQNKGNIYLAKVIRVEPSLQAAFVDYGGNRHGFLAFSEIHPDYYQIPVADRERLLAEVQQHAHDDDDAPGTDDQPASEQTSAPDDHDDHAHESHDHDGHDHADPSVEATDAAHEQDFQDQGGITPTEAAGTEVQQLSFLSPSVSSGPIIEEPVEVEPAAVTAETAPGAIDPPETSSVANPEPEAAAPTVGDTAADRAADDIPAPRFTSAEAYDGIEGASSDAAFAATVDNLAPAQQAVTDEGSPSVADDFGERSSQVEDVPVEERPVDTVGGGEEVEDADDEADDEDSKRRRRFLASRHYKIQEVIKRRQIMLVQVVKEERGNKGAALTTYLSLAGRYCVLMPNSSRGGGVSRKITNATDRRRLKSIMAELQPPKTAAVILRTAGAERSKPEIKRDYEYLMRTWDVIRENTLQSRAPALIHEEGNLIKRAIRDVYSKDIEDILVEGEEGYKTAKDFMRMLTPSHSKKVQRYGDSNISLFQRYQVESQLEAINTPVVQLRSGGSIVFGQTEALVAIDVNSGRATRERHIEETALKTNIEAADEIARQLRLRDLAGLVVIDFIDMEENRNNHAVERRLKEALKQDRARIQVGRISHFGLLELSRQRLRPSLIETNFRPCTHCGGTGLIRSTESSSIYALRMLEEEGIRRRSSELTVTVHPDVALYLLNYKREQLASLEARYGLRIFVLGDAHLIQPNLRIDRVKATRQHTEDAPPPQQLPPPAPEPDSDVEDDIEIEEEDMAGDASEAADQSQSETAQDDERGRGRGRGRRRRRRGRGRDRDGRDNRDFAPRPSEAGDEAPQAASETGLEQPGGDAAEAGESHDGFESGEAAPGSEDRQGESEGREGRGRRRRRGRRGGRRRRREGGEPGQPLSSEHGGMDADLGRDESPAPDAANDDAGASYDREDSSIEPHAPVPIAAASEESQPATGKRRGFFSAIRETALSWTRNDDTGEPTTPQSASASVAAPAPVVALAPEPVAAAPVMLPEPVAPPPEPVQATPQPPMEETPAGPPRRGWWSQPKE